MVSLKAGWNIQTMDDTRSNFPYIGGGGGWGEWVFWIRLYAYPASYMLSLILAIVIVIFQEWLFIVYTYQN